MVCKNREEACSVVDSLLVVHNNPFLSSPACLALGLHTVSFPLGGWSAQKQTLEQQSVEVLTRGAHAYLHIPVQADGREEQALHVLKCYGALLSIVNKKCQGLSV
jgi:hypothetical protein